MTNFLEENTCDPERKKRKKVWFELNTKYPGPSKLKGKMKLQRNNEKYYEPVLVEDY